MNLTSREFPRSISKDIMEFDKNAQRAVREAVISTHTVSFHLRNIYAKLHVHSKTEAVAKALHESLV